MAEDIVYINMDEGIKRVMNNAKLYVKLLAKFKDDTTLNDVFSFLDAGDYEKARSAAHTIKGMAGNLSFTELYNQILALETQIKAQAVDTGQIEKVKLVFAATIARIDEVIAQNG
jgi:HPt (histidine-containing phosphotransfer) domain-containing protein